MPSKHGEIHVDKTLSNLSLKYSNGALIADEIFPRLRVRHESDKYFVYGRQDQRIYSTLRGNGAPANQVLSWAATTSTYSCEEYALKDIVTQRDRDNADDALDPEFDATENLTQMILLDRERRAAALCVYASFSASDNRVQLSGTEQWDNASFDSDSPTDAIEARIDVGKEAIRAATGMEPNHIVIPAAVAKVVKRDASIRDLIKYTQNDLLVNGDLPPTMFNMQVHIPGAIYDSANMGQAFSGADIWGKSVLMFYRPQGTPSKRQVAFGLTFESRERQVKKWVDEDLDGTVVQVGEILDEAVISEYCGYIIDAAIA